MNRPKTLVLTLLLLTSGSPARADFIVNLANGHAYELIITPSPVNWDQASAATSALGGYLATVISAQEQAFIEANFDFVNIPGNGVYIGGFQPAGSLEPAGSWRWVTGEPFVYTHWGPGEPNNLGGEDVLEFPQNTSFNWNGISRNNLRQAYLVEWDTPPSPVPAPPALVLTLSSGVSLLGWGWVRRKRVA
jgi:hypothetical protein